MAGRTKRNLSRGVGEAPVDPSLTPSNPNTETPLPSGAPEIVGIGIVSETVAVPTTAAQPEPGKPRRSRSRKQPEVALEAVEPIPPAALPLPALLVEASQALRVVKEQSTEVQAHLRLMRNELQGMVREAAEVRQGSVELKRELLEMGKVAGQLHQVRMVHEELQETLRQAAEVKEKTLCVKQEVLATENALAELRSTLQTTQRLREEVQAAGQDVKEVKARSKGVARELQTTEESLKVIRQTLDGLGEDMKAQFREAGTRFLTIGEACKDLEKEIQHLEARVEALSPALKEPPAPVVTVAVSGAPAVVSSPVAEPAAVVESAAADSTNAPAEEAHPEGKRQLGITVDPKAVVVEVLPESPAEKAGLHAGDVVLGVDGKPIASSADLRTAIDQASASEPVSLTVGRGAETEEMTAHLAEAPLS